MVITEHSRYVFVSLREAGSWAESSKHSLDVGDSDDLSCTAPLAAWPQPGLYLHQQHRPAMILYVFPIWRSKGVQSISTDGENMTFVPLNRGALLQGVLCEEEENAWPFGGPSVQASWASHHERRRIGGSVEMPPKLCHQWRPLITITSSGEVLRAEVPTVRLSANRQSDVFSSLFSISACFKVQQLQPSQRWHCYWTAYKIALVSLLKWNINRAVAKFENVTTVLFKGKQHLTC